SLTQYQIRLIIYFNPMRQKLRTDILLMRCADHKSYLQPSFPSPDGSILSIMPSIPIHKPLCMLYPFRGTDDKVRQTSSPACPAVYSSRLRIHFHTVYPATGCRQSCLRR